METCIYCDVECVVVTLPEEEITWGMPDRLPHGQHIFTIRDSQYYRCPKCGNEWLTMEQMKAHNLKMNEWIKANLGFDWLASNEVRRTSWKIARDKLKKNASNS